MSVDRPETVRPPAAADVQRGAYRSLNEDGVVDLALGLGLLSAALFVGLGHLARANTAFWFVFTPIVVMLISRGLRKRYVYPRIGYARSRPASPAILMTATVNLLLVAGLIVTVVYAQRGIRPPASLFPWLFRALALAGAGTLALMGRRTGLVRFYVHAGVIAAAVLVSLAIPGAHYGLLLMLGLPGLVLLVTGTVCFLVFLRRHPTPAPEATHAGF